MKLQNVKFKYMYQLKVVNVILTGKKPCTREIIPALLSCLKLTCNMSSAWAVELSFTDR